MPWEKTFAESDVIEQAMHVFWEKGYAATSISDITEATGIKRGSLYNAFEGKDDLFLQSLRKYDADKRRASMRELDEIEDPCEAISTFFQHVIQHSLEDQHKKGCLLVNTSLEYPHHNPQVQQVVDEAFKDTAAFFEKQIKRGQKSGQISESVTPRPTAKALVASLVGIHVMGRGAFGRAALQQIAEQAQRLIA